MSKIFKLDEFGYSVEIGKVAGQADGAAWFRQGDTLLLATVVSNPAKEFPGFLPLTIDYREPFIYSRRNVIAVLISKKNITS